MRFWSEVEIQDKLTDRQYEVLALVARRYSSKDIGRDLGLSYRTVDGYISEIVMRLEVSNRAEAGRLFLQAQVEKPVQNDPVENTGVAETLDEPNQIEPISPQPPDTEEAEENTENEERPQSRSAGIGYSLKSFFSLPPVGGRLHEMTWEQRLGTVGRISLMALLFVAATVTLIARLLDLLNR